MTIQQIVANERTAPDRAAAFRGIAELLDRLPAPYMVHFDGRSMDSTYLKIQLATTEDFDVWVEALGTTAWKRNVRYDTTLQSAAEGVDWRGWRVHLDACVFAPETAEAVA